MKMFAYLRKLISPNMSVNRNQDWALAGTRDEMDLLMFTKFVKKNFLDGLTYVDVGAHEGRYINAVLENTDTEFTKIHAYEANPSLCRVLRNRFPVVSVANLAIADQVGRVKFNVCNYDGLSALTVRSKGLPLGATYEEIEVLSSTLDNLFANDTKIDLIKIDVEGAEFEVLKGAVEIIRRNHPIILVEHGPTEDTTDASLTLELFSLVIQLGYSIYTIDGFRIDDEDKWLDIYFNHSIWNYWLIKDSDLRL